MNVALVRASVHAKLLRLRALDRLVESRRFEAACRVAGENDSPAFEAVNSVNPEALDAWMNAILVKEFDDMSVRELRIRAARLQIPFYTTFAKTALILKILEVQEANARKAEQTAVGLPLSEVVNHPQSAGEHRRELPDSQGIGGTGNGCHQD